MKETIVNLTFISLFITSFLSPSIAVQVKQLGWEDLIGKFEFEDPFTALTADQLADLGLVARVRQLRTHGGDDSDSMAKEMEDATVRLDEAGVDIDGLLAKREEIRELRRQRDSAVVEELHGQLVRLPGYALSLEYSGSRVTEFLLVPWVGACIHTPPPPPNQIVHVRVDQGIENQGLFRPVWVTGEMTVKAAKKNLFLVDGSAGIDVGYTLKAHLVEPYEM